MLARIGNLVLEHQVIGCKNGYLSEDVSSIEQAIHLFEADMELNNEYRKAGVRWSSHSEMVLNEKPFTGASTQCRNQRSGRCPRCDRNEKVVQRIIGE